MKRHALRSSLVVASLLILDSTVSAQSIPGWETKQFSMERLDADRIRLMREVEVIGVGPNEGQQIFADDLLWNTRTGELSAEGSVLLVSKTGRIAAERVTFNTRTGLGTFHTASGMASLANVDAEQRSMFGTLEPDVYFYGETIEKIGEDKYRIKRGGFTTCVQPTPRWDVVSGTATINLEDYAILRNAVLRVKDVPVFYLPVLYYPIQSDDRATGFLLPTYGSSTYRGQSISNAFFWAINRSQDATFFHDFRFSRGQGFGTEYRYVMAPGSEGNLRAYRSLEDAATLETDSGTTETPERESFELRGSMLQRLPAGMSARARLDYFSDITTRQLYQNNFLDLNYSTRVLAGGVSGAWKSVSLSVEANRYESFQGADFSTVYGSLPAITTMISSQRVGRLPLFFSVNSTISNALSKTIAGDVEIDRGMFQSSLAPSLRAPILKLPYLTTTASLVYRDEYYSEQIINDVQVGNAVSRRFFEISAEAIGPVLTRVFAPGGGQGARLKHVIEPIVGVRKTTDFDNPILPFPDLYTFPGVTRVNYGVNNRLLLRPAASGEETTAKPPREILSVAMDQSYYSDPRASVFDSQYSLSYFYRPPNSVSPLNITVRSSPATGVGTDLRTEIDTTGTSNKRLLGLALTGTVGSRRVQASGGWSQRSSLGDATRPDSYLQGSGTLRTANDAIGGTYTFNYDINRSTLFQQRWTGHYNTQCCGILLEYQQYNFPSDPRFPVPSDRRFNLSFTLAGVGAFSNFFGAFGGNTSRF
jgi:LPS-assembly protein